jgi:dephospho-CoA kinase
MIIIGLTGGIAMGKTTVAKQFAQCGVAVCDSDHIVHQLLGVGGDAVESVGKLFPNALQNNHIDRKVLAKEVFGNDTKLHALEAIIHPLVRKHQDAFIVQSRLQKKSIVLLDIPLLFETQGEARCDYTVTVSTPTFLQRQRALKRPQMTAEKLGHILARQMPHSEKRKRADFIVFTGLGKHHSLKMVQCILNTIKKHTLSVPLTK